MASRFNVFGDDPKNSSVAHLIAEGAYVSASFARYYFVSKIELGLVVNFWTHKKSHYLSRKNEINVQLRMVVYNQCPL